MRKWRVPHLTVAAVVGLVLGGCAQTPSGSDEPMPTDHPNEVVLKVPGMT